MASASSVYEWTLRPPAGAVDGLVVAFALTRTRFLLVSLVGSAGGVTLERVRQGSRFYKLEHGYPAGARLRVVFDGNAPLIARIAWIQPKRVGSLLVHALPSWFADLFDPSAPPDEKEPLTTLLLEKFNDLASIGEVLEPGEVARFLNEHEPDSSELFRNRERAIDWHFRAQTFFLRLDLETKYELVPERWQEILHRVGHRLARRLEVRARLGNEEPAAQVPIFGPLEPSWFLGKRDLHDLQTISVYLCNLITSSLENYGGAELVAWAFEMFATDRLAVHHVDLDTHLFLQGHGAANGLVFLQFGEFALYCLENGVDVEVWGRNLDALVRATHAFAETAQDPTIVGPGPHAPKAYEFREGRLHRRLRLDELRKESKIAIELSAKTNKDPLLFYQDRFTSLVAQAQSGCVGPTLAKRRPLTCGHEAEIKPRGVYPWDPPPPPASS